MFLGWSHGEAFRDIDLSAAAGQIVALVGVEGSGARELLRSFAGLEPCTGEIAIAGRDGSRVAASQRLRSGHTGASASIQNFSVGENLLVRLGMPDIAGFGLALKKKLMAALALEGRCGAFSSRPRTSRKAIRSLSGGNQQKVAIAQALNCTPRLLLLEEPTRGVDIQSKKEIYRLLRDFAAAGNVVIMFCTEVLEVFEAADRAHVITDGRMSPPIVVHDYAHVERLATDITLMERHNRVNSLR